MMDLEYCKQRNKLIPIAESHANETAGTGWYAMINRESWGLLWNKCFHTKMDELWREKVKNKKHNESLVFTS